MRVFIDYVLAIVAIFLVFPSISAQDNNGYNNDYEYGDNGYSNDYEYGYEQEDNLYYDYAERQQQKKYVFFFVHSSSSSSSYKSIMHKHWYSMEWT